MQTITLMQQGETGQGIPRYEVSDSDQGRASLGGKGNRL